MSPENELIEKLVTLNHIAETLNRAVDVREVLEQTLARMVELMGLETGWIFLKDPLAQDRQWGSGYTLAAHHNLPPAMQLDNQDAWLGGCECQDLCNRNCLNKAYNEVRCSRLGQVHGDRRGLALHASTPLRAGERALGILNVAGPDWSSFSPQALAILTNVGNQIGVALERAQLFDLLKERRIQEQAALLEFSNQLLSRPDLDELIDFLVGQVRQVMGADACALLLPGEEEGQLDFRATKGWQQDPVAQGRQVPADEQSGAGLVMRTQQPLLVVDIEQHDPVPWLPDWVRAEGFRGHAIVPLIARGRSVGALVLDSRRPCHLDQDEIRLLRLLANQAAMALENARLHQEEVKGQRLEREMELGQQIQLSQLPKAPPVVLPGWEFAAFYLAARQVGGDFYGFFELPGEPGRLGMLIADVAGKGVPAALFMAQCHTTIRTVALSGGSPSAVLRQANELIVDDSRSDLFLTAFYATLDTGSGRLDWTSAGHNPPLWHQAATGQIEQLRVPGIIVGIFRDIELEERRTDLAPGDLLVFYTDGVTEAMDADHEPFDLDRLEAVVAANAGATAQEVLDAVVAAIHDFTGHVPQSDDITLFVVRRCP